MNQEFHEDTMDSSQLKKRPVSLEEIPTSTAGTNTLSFSAVSAETSPTTNNNPNSTSIFSSSIDNSYDDKKSNRGNYRCSRCNLPKKGHKCPYQPVFRKRENGSVETYDVEIQVCMDEQMTVAMLGDLSRQGFPDSYILSNIAINNPGVENAHSYPYAAMDAAYMGSGASVASDPSV